MTMIEDAKKALEKSIGLPLEQVRELNLDEEFAFVERKTGKALNFPTGFDPRKRARGNPLLARGKIVTREEINAKIDALE